MKITRIQLKNFLGLASLEADVPDAGAIVTGGNARGKSTVLKAIAASLQAQGVGPEAIRLGADKAENAKIQARLDHGWWARLCRWWRR